MFTVGNKMLAEMFMKNCSLPQQCVTASVNLGIIKTVISNQCCDTKLCNYQSEPGTFQWMPFCDNKWKYVELLYQIIYIASFNTVLYRSMSFVILSLFHRITQKCPKWYNVSHLHWRRLLFNFVLCWWWRSLHQS